MEDKQQYLPKQKKHLQVVIANAFFSKFFRAIYGLDKVTGSICPLKNWCPVSTKLAIKVAICGASSGAL